ncbi:MAG: cytochrome b/b6 domain-containing protein [Hydrogenobaculum sp.]
MIINLYQHQAFIILTILRYGDKMNLHNFRYRALIIALWIYILTNNSIRAHFFPYSHWDEVVSDFKNLTRFKLAETGPRPGLPGFVHGLGLIDVSIVLMAGVVMHFLFPFSLKDPSLKPIVYIFMEIHDFFGNSMWVYMVGHAFMALLHRVVSK